MSGGFFRGTSADQDTRFSNKQAKLLKSQKFAPELDQLVDTTKMKMDVIRPWIVTRATEFLGFEDEVLINFIYGLLDGKEVDGKQIQIQLTGFMEKNTGKFMKELWSLLLSAQKNASGVPQQFLDAKEEETRKKKAEADHITHELQKKEREGRELEREQQKEMDDEMDVLKITNTTAISKNSLLKASEDREAGGRLGLEGKNRLSKSPPAVHRSPPHRSSPPASRSRSKSFSNSRSYSRSPYSSERNESRSISGSPQQQKFSPPLESRRHSPIHSSRRRHSPQYPRSPFRRRSPLPVRLRSPLPLRRRSPPLERHISPIPVRRRSPTRVWHRSPSPVQRRSRTPVRRRSPSPIRRRSPSPFRWRSPSPFRRKPPSPRWRSPSPMRRRSPLARSPRFRRRSPMRSPARRRVVNSQVSPRQINRSRSPCGSRSPSKRRRSLSRELDGCVNGVESRRHRDDYASERSRTKRSPDRHALEREDFEHPGRGHKGPESISHQLPISLRSPQRDVMPQIDYRNKVSALSSPVDESPSESECRSPPRVQKMNPDKYKRKPSPVENPVRPTRERVIRHDRPEISGEEEKGHSRETLTERDDSLKVKPKNSSTAGIRNKSPAKVVVQEYSPPDYSILRKKNNNPRSGSPPWIVHPEGRTQQASFVSEEIEYGPGRLGRENFPPSAKLLARVPSSQDEKFSAGQVSLKKSYSREGYRLDEKKQTLSSNVEYRDSGQKTDAVQKSSKRVEQNYQVAPFDVDGEEKESYRSRDIYKRKKKRQQSLEVAWNNEAGHASPIDERKEAKRRKKEEKRSRREERHRRREERHLRREERRADKKKSKSMVIATPPSDNEKNHGDADDSEDDDVARGRDPHPSLTEEADSEQKRLEIELRKKALESLRAKKATSH